jgi:hypothetical protein
VTDCESRGWVVLSETRQTAGVTAADMSVKMSLLFAPGSDLSPGAAAAECAQKPRLEVNAGPPLVTPVPKSNPREAERASLRKEGATGVIPALRPRTFGRQGAKLVPSKAESGSPTIWALKWTPDFALRPRAFERQAAKLVPSKAGSGNPPWRRGGASPLQPSFPRKREPSSP